MYLFMVFNDLRECSTQKCGINETMVLKFNHDRRIISCWYPDTQTTDPALTLAKFICPFRCCTLYSSSDVIIKLRNRGPEAYRSQEYGESIIVERRITAEGGGGYKIKSAAGKLVTMETYFQNDHQNQETYFQETIFLQSLIFLSRLFRKK